jgi:hypothetical protein
MQERVLGMMAQEFEGPSSQFMWKHAKNDDLFLDGKVRNQLGKVGRGPIGKALFKAREIALLDHVPNLWFQQWRKHKFEFNSCRNLAVTFLKDSRFPSGGLLQLSARDETSGFTQLP